MATAIDIGQANPNVDVDFEWQRTRFYPILTTIRGRALIFSVSLRRKSIRELGPWAYKGDIWLGVLSIVEAKGDSSLAPSEGTASILYSDSEGGDLWPSLIAEKGDSIGDHQNKYRVDYCTRSWNWTHACAGGSCGFTLLYQHYWKVVNFTQGWSTQYMRSATLSPLFLLCTLDSIHT